MPTDHILSLLIAERDKLSRAIEALTGQAKRRGRPPKNPTVAYTRASASVTAAPARKKRHFSAAQRAAAAKRMRLRWAAKRKAERKAGKKTKL